MSKDKILLVDDEPHIIELAKMYLENENFQVITAADGRAALKVFEEEAPALLILDLMLPQIDGWDVCRRIRAQSNIPIIMLSARSDDVDKIVGLELGADDYLTKPFNPRELVARVKALLRRIRLDDAEAQTARKESISAGPLEIDIASREVRLGGRELRLRTKEFDLLKVLVENQGVVLSRDQLLNLAWGYDFYGETRTVDVHIAHLRDKLSHPALHIETMWGLGYKFSVE
jgi:two-component system, OmpR family, alkaline phosphatase synthesis response regulator PhoP